MPDEEEEFALAVYRALRAGGLGTAAGLDDDQVRRGLDRLRELGLVEGKEEAEAESTEGAETAEGAAAAAGADGPRRVRGAGLEPVEPDTALIRIMDAYDAAAAEQARVSESLRRLARSLTTARRTAAAPAVSGVEVEYISGRRHKDRTLHELNATARFRCDSLHPGPMPPMAVLESSLEQDAALLARGVEVRAIYPQSILRTPEYARYVEDMTGLGAQVRFVDHAPSDLLLFDQASACVPADPGDPGASILVVRGTSLIKAYVAVFEDYWLRAASSPCPPSGHGGPELTAQERAVIRLMAGGLTDDQIARRMGVHRRTVQRAVAKLMERLGAGSRFEAGLRLAHDPEFARGARPGGRG